MPAFDMRNCRRAHAITHFSPPMCGLNKEESRQRRRKRARGRLEKARQTVRAGSRHETGYQRRRLAAEIEESKDVE